MNPYLDSSEKGNMSYNSFLKIVKQFPRTKKIILQGLGEIFLNKDIFKMLTYLKKNGYYVQFATNCSLLTERDMKNIAELGIDEIRLSIDTLNPILYEEIRGVNSFNRVIENIRNIAQIVNDNSFMMINMVVSQDNINEVADMVDFAAANNIDTVRVSWIQQKGVKAQRKFVSGRMLPTMNLIEIRKTSIKKGIKLIVNIPNIKHAINCKSIYNSLLSPRKSKIDKFR
jgi:MoaA/NifB/PqqE/SkfB family radical SAM enzyme